MAGDERLEPKVSREDGRRKRERDRPPDASSVKSPNGERRGQDVGSGKYKTFSSSTGKKRRDDVKGNEKQDSTIFVGDLDSSTSGEELKALFQKFGNVLGVKIIVDNCYGFVTFDKREAAEMAIAAGQRADEVISLNNKQVYVSWALGSLPEWKKGVGGFAAQPGTLQPNPRSRRRGLQKPSVLAAATAAAAAKAHSVLAGSGCPPPTKIVPDQQTRAIIAYDDLL